MCHISTVLSAAEGASMPPPYEIEHDGETAIVAFYTNAVQVDAVEDKAEKWEYDVYILRIRDRAGLSANIESNYEAWLQLARDAEYDVLAREVRGKRDRLLTESDWTQMPDVPLSEPEQDAWRAYRQTLRAVPQQPGFPYWVVWPNIIS